MRALITFLIFVGGTLAPNAAADAAGKGKRIAKPSHFYAAQPRRRLGSARARRACTYDRGSYFRRFPCWARKAFSEGRK